MFCKEEVLKNFEKFTRKHLCWRLLKKRLRSQAGIETISSYTKANFAILFSSENIKTENSSFLKIEGVP